MSFPVFGLAKCMKSHYRWDLRRNNIERTRPANAILSPMFAIHQFYFQLELYPKTGRDKSSSHASIFLKLLSNIRLRVKFHLSILGNDGKKYAAIDDIRIFDSQKNPASWGDYEFIRESELTSNDNFYCHGDLRICCEISFGCAIRDDINEIPKFYDDEVVTATTELSSPPPPSKRPRLQNSPSTVQAQEVTQSEASVTTISNDNNSNPLEKYFDSERRSDVKFVLADGKFIHAHAIVLENKSDAFADMFSNEISVIAPAIVDIKNMDYDVLRETIRFVYTDKVNDLDKFAEKLLEPANRFALEDLKILCERYLCDKLVIGNIVRIFVLAEDYKLSSLKESVKKFVTENIKDVVNLVEFENLMNDRPSVALEIIRCNTDNDKAST